MLSEEELQEYINYAKSLYHAGHDNRSIVIQLAASEIPDKDIDIIMKRLKSIRKYDLRQEGVKQLLLGMSFTVVGTLIAYWLMDYEYSVGFVAMGLPMLGVTIVAKGIFNILGW
jgi:hypothetical protein